MKCCTYVITKEKEQKILSFKNVVKQCKNLQWQKQFLKARVPMIIPEKGY